MRDIRAVEISSHDVVTVNTQDLDSLDTERVIHGRISAAIVEKAMCHSSAVEIGSHDIVAGNALGNGSIDAERVSQGRIGASADVVEKTVMIKRAVHI